MRFKKDKNLSPRSRHVSHPFGGNQRGLPIILVCGLLAACGDVTKVAEDAFDVPGNFVGMVAADEPQAVLVGRDVLTVGGNAADAAVAMAFAMTVTLPSQVGLGSIGICMVYDHGQKMVDSIVFVPRPVGPVGGESSLVPGLPRGLFLLNANYGHSRWDQLLGPAEAMAQRGVPASRAFIRQFAPVSAAVLADPVARRVFTREGGQPIVEGDLIRNPQLGATLGRMALHGVGEFYSGPWAQEFAASARRAGASFGEQDLRAFAPQSVKPLPVPYGHDTAYFAPPPALRGAAEAAAWTHLAAEGAYKDASPESRQGLVSQTLAQVTNGSTSAAATGGASLVAVDATGSAVVCQFTLNRDFGTGSMVDGFGTYLAVPTPNPGLALGPMIAINANSNEFRMAIAASGGAGALLRTAAESLLLDRPLKDAVNAAIAGADPGAPAGIEVGRCGSGKPDIARCAAAADPRGAGLADTMAGK
jgi:gamma-glutamyltranspeptidase/glutathione hydrolase